MGVAIAELLEMLFAWLLNIFLSQISLQQVNSVKVRTPDLHNCSR